MSPIHADVFVTPSSDLNTIVPKTNSDTEILRIQSTTRPSTPEIEKHKVLFLPAFLLANPDPSAGEAESETIAYSRP